MIPLLDLQISHREIGIVLLLGYVAGVWALLSARTARVWAKSRVDDVESLRRAEEKLTFVVGQEQLEARLSSRLYYSFVAGLAAAVFLVIEAVVGEFLDENIELRGYTGAIIMALGVAIAIYPIHQMTSRLLVRHPNQEESNGADDLPSAAKEVGRSLGQFLRSFTVSRMRDLIAVVLIVSVITAFSLVYVRLAG